MKKFIAIALVLSMALCLCACGEKERYPELADMLDAKDYENAMQYIYDLYQQDQLQGDGEGEGNGEGEGEGNGEGNGEGEGEPTPTVTEPPRPTEEEWEVLRAYRDIVLKLGSYLEDGYISIWVEEDNTSYNGSDALKICYEKLNALDKMVIDKWKITEFCGPDYLGDYEGNPLNWDYDAYLASFSHLENVLLKEEHSTLDHMENVSERDYDEPVWSYNPDGTVKRVDNPSYAFELIETAPYNLYGEQEITYSDAGVPTKIKYMSGDKVNYIVEITYDANGNKIKEHIKENQGELDITYEYDDQNRLVKIELPSYIDSDNIYTYTYEYDDAGRVTKETKTYHYYYEYYDADLVSSKNIRSFKYDANGNLTTGTEKYESWSYNTEWQADGSYKVKPYISYEKLDQYTFTCDAEGNLTKMVINYGDYYYVYGDNAGAVYDEADLVSKTVEFVYGDYWFYTVAE